MNPNLQEILHNITSRLATLEQNAESDKLLITLIQEQRSEIDRLRQALAQPDHPLDKKADNARELGLDYEPEQEPVAWGFKSKSGAIIDCISHEQHEILAGEYDHPLYTSPPRKESENPDGAFIDEGSKPEQEFKYTPYGLRSDENGKLSIGEISQRKWVGLTFKDLPDEKFGNLDFRRGALWAEDKLKEKNHAV